MSHLHVCRFMLDIFCVDRYVYIYIYIIHIYIYDTFDYIQHYTKKVHIKHIKTSLFHVDYADSTNIVHTCSQHTCSQHTCSQLAGGFNPSENMSSSLGMMKFPIYGKIRHVPNHQVVTLWQLIPPRHSMACNDGYCSIGVSCDSWDDPPSMGM